jgi:Protein of unknown function (DUF1571)
MWSSKRFAVFALSLSASVGLIGCISFPSSTPPPPDLLNNPRLKAARAPAAPDLRIPPTQVAQAGDIPVVPLPPIPRGSSVPLQSPAGQAPPAGPIVPVAGTSPAVQPPSAPPIPLPPLASTPTTPSNSPPMLVGSQSGPALSPTQADPKPEEATAPAPRGDSIKILQQQSVEAYARMDSYIARLTRREVVGGQPKPEEVMLFKFRKEPWSVYFKWLGEEGKGREVVYVKKHYDDKIHTLLAKADVVPLFTPANGQMALAIDSPLVRSASRHSITEAGIGSCVEHLSRIIDGMDRGERKLGVLRDLGLQQRPEYSTPMPMIEHIIPPGLEAELPRGGKRQYGFDPSTHLPVLVITRDDKGQEVEYYRYDQILFPVKLDADDFNPDKLWNSPAPRPTATKR